MIHRRTLLKGAAAAAFGIPAAAEAIDMPVLPAAPERFMRRFRVFAGDKAYVDQMVFDAAIKEAARFGRVVFLADLKTSEAAKEAAARHNPPIKTDSIVDHYFHHPEKGLGLPGLHESGRIPTFRENIRSDPDSVYMQDIHDPGLKNAYQGVPWHHYAWDIAHDVVIGVPVSDTPTAFAKLLEGTSRSYWEWSGDKLREKITILMNGNDVTDDFLDFARDLTNYEA